MNALTTIDANAHPAATSHAGGAASLAPLPQAGGAGSDTTIDQAPTAGPHGAGHTIFGPKAQAEFLQHLQLFGNVRHACKVARVSAQTAYRQRRASPALARAWDAALLAARAHAEATLADRAVNGWEEAVYYHGEEIARRRRYSDRLLLAHLARLDRLEECGETVDALAVLDDVIDALRDGEDIGTAFSCSAHPEPVEGAHCASGGCSKKRAGLRQARSERGRELKPQDRVPCVPSCRAGERASNRGGKTGERKDELGPEDWMWLGNRLDRMDDARPRGARMPLFLASYCMGDPVEAMGPGATWDSAIEWAQMLAFEAGEAEWWKAMPEGQTYPHYLDEEEEEEKERAEEKSETEPTPDA